MKINEKVKIKWNGFIIMRDIITSTDKVMDNFFPDEFLKYAKDDFNYLTLNGFVNAVSNSKRAIDCQVDWILSYLGYDYLKFNEQKYPHLRDFLDKKNIKTSSSFKQTVIQALGIAPTFLISNIRKVRHQLEHEYFPPNKKNAIDAIELAELFINATQYVLFSKIWTNYIITNREIKDGRYTSPAIVVGFNPNYQNSYFSLYCRYGRSQRETIFLKPQDSKYLDLIYVAITNDFHHLYDVFDVSINKEKFKFKISDVKI